MTSLLTSCSDVTTELKLKLRSDTNCCWTSLETDNSCDKVAADMEVKVQSSCC